jgi:hypothetical protein
VDIVSSAATLALIGLLLSQPFDGLLAVPISARALRALKYTVVFSLLFTAMMIAIDLVKNIGRVSRRGLDRAAQSRVR